MFRDEDYIKKSRDYINRERDYVISVVSQFTHAKYYEPMGNFILIKLLDQVTTSSQLFDTCMKEGLMIRDCSSFPFLDNSYIRFCFMSHEKNEELLHILKQELQQNGANEKRSHKTLSRFMALFLFLIFFYK